MTAALLLHETPPLSQVIDAEALREVVKSISELFGIGIKAFDVEGKKLADVRVSTGEHCGYLFSRPMTQSMCTSLVGQIRAQELKLGKVERVECFSGLRYRILPLAYEGSVVGRVILGPYRPLELDAPPAALGSLASDGLSIERLANYLQGIPRASEEAIDKVLAHVGSVLDVLVHTSVKNYMTSKLHIASISGAHADLERTNRALRYANERLEELDRLKSNFIATVSHELRTPLTSVIGYSEMLLEGMAGELNQEQRSYVGTILEKGESLLVLIGQVLDLSRIESGNVTLHKSQADIRDLCARAVSDVVPQAKKRNLNVRVEIDSAVSSMLADADKLRRVVSNLLGNAVKFTPEGGEVLLRVDLCEDIPVGDTSLDIFAPQRNTFLRISVKDSGIGIAADQLEHVFDAFFQVDNTSTREFGGTGLGLAIVKNFVSAHEGRVEVHSVVGKGSEFVVKLPYYAES